MRLQEHVILLASIGMVLAGCGTGAATEVITAVPEMAEFEETEAAAEIEETGEAVTEATATEEQSPEIAIVEDATEEAVSGDSSTALPALPAAVFTASEGEDGGDSVWVWRPGGSPSMLAGGGDIIDKVVVSDDGTVAVFERRRLERPQTTSVWAVNTDGTNEREIVSGDDLLGMVQFEDGWGSTLTGADFVPGTHSLLFSTRTQIDAPGVYVNRDLWMLDVDTGELISLLEPDLSFLRTFLISPDGTQVALITEESIGVMAIDGSSRADNLVTYQAPPTGASYQLADVSWSSDGASLIVGVPPEDILGDEQLPHTLLRVPVDGSPPVDLSQFLAEGLFGAFFNAQGSALVYFEGVGEPAENIRALHMVTLDGGVTDTTVLTEPYLRPRAWDQGGDRYFAFRSDQPLLYMIEIGQEAVLLEGAVYNAEDWINNSMGLIGDDTLLYVSYTEDRSAYALWQVTPGSEPRVVMVLNGSFEYFIPKLIVVR